MNESQGLKTIVDRMRVLLLSTSYPHDVADWRGVFVSRMVDALARSDDIHLSVWAPPGELPTPVTSATTPAESAWLAALMSAGGISHLMRQGGLNSLLAPLKLLRMLASAYRRNTDIDVYHVNWLQCALPLPDNGKPALITALGNDLKLLRLPFVRHFLRRAMRRRRVALCPNAEWMQAPLEAAFGDIAEVIPVSFGIEERWYAIQRQSAGSQPRRWLVVTRLTADKLGPLFEWSRGCFANGDRELHLFGPMQENIAIPDWVHYHGAASPHQLASQWFPQACGLVTLSRHAEGRPQVMLEAMAAGLPIIASDMPAHAALVESGKTGILCSSAEAYRQALEQLEEDTTNQRFGEAARQRAANRFGTWDDCARRYTTIYRRLLEGSVDG